MREAELPAGRRQQVHPSNHERDTIPRVVDGDRKVVRPMAIAVADEDIAEFVGRRIALDPEQRVPEFFRPRIDLDA